MKIKRISCTQFAGVRDRDVSFADGINVIYGKNESGKSTLVNLLSRTLFQNAKLDRRSDKAFYELYFPSAQKGRGITGDFVDGKITFETEHGTYTLSKEWGTEARCTLSTPDGVIRAQGKIDEALREALLYGEGVYADMLFSSQKNTDLSLQTILDASKKTDAKQEITNAVSRAFAESDGISVDAIEEAIEKKIEEIAGKHWDLERGAPVRRAARWSNGLGEILKAYYAWEDARSVLEEISRLEAEADRAAEAYTDKDTAAAAAEEAYHQFNHFAGRLAGLSDRKKAIDRLSHDLLKVADVLAEWPRLIEQLERAKILQAEKADRELWDKYEAVKAIAEECEALQKLAPPRCPSDEEIFAVKTAQRGITTLENKLCGMNLTAAIRMLHHDSITVTSLRTGEPVEIADGIASISEAVRITVPGIMEMQLAPADVDVAAVESKIAAQREVIDSIFDRYAVTSLSALEQMAATAADVANKTERLQNRMSMLLGDTTYEELVAACATLPAAVRPLAQIEREILAVCQSNNLTRFIAAKEAVADSYAAEYNSITELKAKAFDLESELKKAKETVAAVEDIPTEYLHIADPDTHLELLQNRWKLKQSLREAALTEKTAALSKLESYRENLSGDPTAEAEQAERLFEEQKSLLAHWLHIRDAFRAQKENLRDNPLQDIADNFTRYLGIISDGRILSEFPEADKLSMSIYSDSSLLDYGKLSEGTKDTVSLAFRLAVLDHLFPDGGGVIVLDDPFTDMDAERTAQACALIRACALRHQVIFLTCKEEYLSLLEGNTIRF